MVSVTIGALGQQSEFILRRRKNDFFFQLVHLLWLVMGLVKVKDVSEYGWIAYRTWVGDGDWARKRTFSAPTHKPQAS